jgi:hypothetical protein
MKLKKGILKALLTNKNLLKNVIFINPLSNTYIIIFELTQFILILKELGNLKQKYGRKFFSKS